MTTFAKKKTLNVRVRQIYFKSLHLGFLDSSFVPYKNEGASHFLENEVYKKMFQEYDYNNSDYYGVLSWKFNQKHKMTGEKLRSLMEKDEYSSDVYSFFGKESKQMMESTKMNTFFDRHHPNLNKIGQSIVSKLFKADISDIKAERIYYNHWIAKSSVWASYVEEMLIPAMLLMEHDREIRDLCWEDAEYNTSPLISNGQTVGQVLQESFNVLSPAKCLDVFGVEYYPHHPFILERLPSIYFALKGYSLKHI